MSRFLSNGGGDAELIAPILQRNQPALDALVEGLTRFGIDWDGPEEILERRDHVVWRKLALLQELESSFLLKGGDSKGALNKLFQMLLRPNSVGRILYEIAIPAYEKILFEKCKENDNLSMTRLLLALKAYKDRNGNLPSVLSDLVPTYFEILPKSDHDGSPFHYSATDRTLSYFFFSGKGGVKEEVLKITF